LNRSFNIEFDKKPQQHSEQELRVVATNNYVESIEVPSNNDKPLISLVIPVLNEEIILEKTLNVYTKLLRKTYNIELIVSDGGSKDKTVEIAKRFSDKLVVHDRPYPQTIAEGRNRGSELASGDILVFINGDTIPEDPDYFFSFINLWACGITEYSNCGAIATAVTAPKDEMQFKDKMFYSAHNFYVKTLNSLGIGMARGECHIIKSSFFKQVGGYTNKIIAGEDFDLYRRLAHITKIAYINKLRVVESPRRFKKDGYIKTLFRWVINSLSVMLFGKSYSDKWEAVR